MTPPLRNRTAPDDRSAIRAATATPPDRLAKPGGSLSDWARHHADALRDTTVTQRIGVDRRVWVDDTGVAELGDPVDIGPACLGLLQTGRGSGDEASACLGRLIVQSIPRFQIADEASTQWGAFASRLTVEPELASLPEDWSVNVSAHARTTSALFAAQKLWPSETRQRCALAAARWILLRQDSDGIPCAENIGSGNTRDVECSPWTALEAAGALSAAHRHSRLPIFQTAARRLVESVSTGLDKNRWEPGTSAPIAVGDAVEALLEFAAVADHARWNRLACRIAETVCRTDFRNLTWEHHAGAAAAWIATARIHDPLGRLGSALTHLNALATKTSFPDSPGAHARAVRLVESFFLRLAGSVPDSNVCPATRAVQLHGCRFEADPATSDHICVESHDGKPLETRLWACSKTFRVLGVALLPDGGNSINILRRGRPIAARCLRTQSVLPTVQTHPFTDSSTATFALFTTV